MKEVNGLVYTHPCRTASSNGVIAAFSPPSSSSSSSRDGRLCNSNDSFFIAVPHLVEKKSKNWFVSLTPSEAVVGQATTLLGLDLEDGPPNWRTTPHPYNHQQSKSSLVNEPHHARSEEHKQLEMSLYHCLVDWNQSHPNGKGTNSRKSGGPVSATLLHRLPIPFPPAPLSTNVSDSSLPSKEVDLPAFFADKKKEPHLLANEMLPLNTAGTSMKPLGETESTKIENAEKEELDDPKLTVDKILWISQSTIALLNAKGDFIVMRSGLSPFNDEEEEEEEEEEDCGDHPRTSLAYATHVVDFAGCSTMELGSIVSHTKGQRQVRDLVFACTSSKGLLAWMLTWESKKGSSLSPSVVAKNFAEERYSYLSCTPISSLANGGLSAGILFVGCSARSSVVLSTRCTDDLHLLSKQEILLGPEYRFLAISMSSVISSPVSKDDRLDNAGVTQSGSCAGSTDEAYRVYIALIGAEENIRGTTRKNGAETTPTDAIMTHTLKGKDGAPLCIDIKESVFDILQQRQLNQLYRPPSRSEVKEGIQEGSSEALSGLSSSILGADALLTSSLVVTPPDIRHGGVVHLLRWDSVSRRCTERSQYAFSDSSAIMKSLPRLMGEGSAMSCTLRVTPQLTPVFHRSGEDNSIQSVEMTLFDQRRANTNVGDTVCDGSGEAGGFALSVPLPSPTTPQLSSGVSIRKSDHKSMHAMSLDINEWSIYGTEGVSGKNTGIHGEMLGMQCISRVHSSGTQQLYIVLTGTRAMELEQARKEAHESDIKVTGTMSTEEKRSVFFGEAAPTGIEGPISKQSIHRRRRKPTANIYDCLSLQCFFAPLHGLNTEKSIEVEPHAVSPNVRGTDFHVDSATFMQTLHDTSCFPSLEAMFRRILKEENEALLRKLHVYGLGNRSTPSTNSEWICPPTMTASSERDGRGKDIHSSVLPLKKVNRGGGNVSSETLDSVRNDVVDGTDFPSVVHQLWKGSYSLEALSKSDRNESHCFSKTLLRRTLQQASGVDSGDGGANLTMQQQFIVRQLMTWTEAFDALCVNNGKLLNGNEEGIKTMLKLGEGLIEMLIKK